MENFNPLEDAIALNEALTPPNNMNSLIKIIAHRSNNQRQEILKEYFKKYKKSLNDDLKSELNGNFKEICISLFYTPVDFDCYQLHEAMKGLGTDEDTLIEILSTRSNERIKEINIRYIELFNTKLKKDIEKDTSGNFRKLLLKLLEGNRSNNNTPIVEDCKDSAKRLYNVALFKKECIYDTFIYIFTKHSREELSLISKFYYEYYFKTLFELIDSLFSGDFKKTLKTMIYALLNPSEYFANRLHEALKGLRTKDNILIRVLVSRDEIDIERIKKYYKQIYKKDLYNVVMEGFNGNYKNLLLELIGN